MKNLKKFAALLLAGAMALLMLTACGGGGSVDKTEEQKVMSLIKDQKGTQVTSDAELRAKAEEHLRKDMNGGFQLGNHKFFANVHVDGVEDDYAIVTVTANYVYSDTLLSALLKALHEGSGRRQGQCEPEWHLVQGRYRDPVRHRAELHRPVYPGQEPPQVNNNSSSFPPECGCKAALRGFFVPVGRGEAPAPFCAVTKAAGKAKSSRMPSKRYAAAFCLPCP